MPTFEIDDLGTASGRFWTACRLHAVLLYPQDATAQDRLMVTYASICLGQPAPPSLPASQAYRINVGRASAEEAFARHGGHRAVSAALGGAKYRQLIEEAAGRWFTAGAILGLLLRMEKHPRVGKLASVNRAVFLLEWERPLSLMPANTKDIREAWSRYRPVAHFCATMLDLTIAADRAASSSAEVNDYIHRMLFEHTDELIGAAAIYQNFGLRYRLPRDGRTPLDPAATYRLGPELTKTDGREIFPLSERLVERALRWRAPKRMV